MKNISKNNRWMRCLLLIAFCTFPAHADEVKQDAPFLSIKTAGFTVRIAPPWAWTLDTIAYRDKVLAEPSGLYGLVIDIANGKFVGSGHREGGREEVLKVELEADGKPVNHLDGGTFTGDNFVFTKHCKIDGLSVKSVLRIKENEIEGEQFVHADKDFKITTMYAYMFPWLTSTSAWIGETIDGKAFEGKFEDKSFVQNSTARWIAVYEPAAKTAAITFFPRHKDEQGFLHFFNDNAAYRKQYWKTMTSREVKAGEEFHYTVKLRAVVAEADSWKEKTRQVAEELKQKYGPAASTAVPKN